MGEKLSSIRYGRGSRRAGTHRYLQQLRLALSKPGFFGLWSSPGSYEVTQNLWTLTRLSRKCRKINSSLFKLLID
jgi:hypothetical protein